MIFRSTSFVGQPACGSRTASSAGSGISLSSGELLSDVRRADPVRPGRDRQDAWLAVRLACEAVTDFPDGAWLVELAEDGRC